jgi:predicted amidohydrolase
VNRVGQDGKGYVYSGDSCVIAPTGEIIFRQQDVPCVHTAVLSYEKVKEFRETFAAWQDADGDMVKFSD